jgi:hypothetical protein
VLLVPLLVHYASPHRHVLPSAVRPWLPLRLGPVMYIYILRPSQRLPVAFLVVECKDSVQILHLRSASRPWKEEAQHLSMSPLGRLQLVAVLVVQSIVVEDAIIAAVLPALMLGTLINTFSPCTGILVCLW